MVSLAPVAAKVIVAGGKHWISSEGKQWHVKKRKKKTRMMDLSIQ